MYKIPIPTRADWRKIRDEQKVPKGAAKVSVGDTLDKVHKSFSLKTLSVHINDLHTLDIVMGMYTESIKTKYPKFPAVIKTKVLTPLKTHRDTMNEIVLQKTKWYPSHSAFMKQMELVKAGQASAKTLVPKLAPIMKIMESYAQMDAVWVGRYANVRESAKLCASKDQLNEKELGLVNNAVTTVQLP